MTLPDDLAANESLASVVRKLCAWAAHEQPIEGVMLVGSYAAGTARPDSDVDLILLAERPFDYIERREWLQPLGTVIRHVVEDYGNVRSVRVFFADVGEFEFGFASPNWASAEPIDSGTRQVLQHGSVVLLDKRGRLERLRSDVAGSVYRIGAATLDEVLAAGLLRELDAELSARYPDAPFHGIDGFQFSLANGYFVVAQICDEAVGCGAFRPLDTGGVEIKRMFVRPAFRGRGIARAILAALHAEARRRGYISAVLETGQRQPEAIALYESEGYEHIEPFGAYVGSGISVCFRKAL